MPPINDHLSDDILEMYSMGRLAEDQAAPIEDHLLVCPACQAKLTETDEFVQLIKKGAANPPAPRRSMFSWSGFSLSWLFPGLRLVPLQVLGVTCAVAAGLLVLSWQTVGRIGGNQAQNVFLDSSRGRPSVASAATGRPINLKVDLTQLPSAAHYRMEIVDALGALVWRHAAAPTGPTLTVAVGRDLRRGNYWVRLYKPDGELLREYGLRID